MDILKYATNQNGININTNDDIKNYYTNTSPQNQKSFGRKIKWIKAYLFFFNKT